MLRTGVECIVRCRTVVSAVAIRKRARRATRRGKWLFAARNHRYPHFLRNQGNRGPPAAGCPF